MSVEETYEVIRKYFIDKPVKKVQVFGSFARRDFNDDSDIDVILTMDQPVGLFKLAGYKLDLQDILRRDVDLATEPAISESFKKIIEKDLTTVYERS